MPSIWNRIHICYLTLYVKWGYMQPNILARIASLWHFTQAGSYIKASEGFVVSRGTDTISGIGSSSGRRIAHTALLAVEVALAIFLAGAINNAGTFSFTEVVTVRDIRRVIFIWHLCPRYIHLHAGVVEAIRISVIIDLHGLSNCWADSEKKSQICRAEELHSGNFEELWQALDRYSFRIAK